MAEAETPNPAFKGSCHCGFVKYTVRLDLSKPNPATGSILSKCNCTICHKSGGLMAAPQPADSLVVTSPPEGTAALTDYTFGSGSVHHMFCPRCGIRCFYRGSYPKDGKTVNFERVNVLTLDSAEDGGPLPDLRDVPVSYWDGRSENWSDGPKTTPASGGVR